MPPGEDDEFLSDTPAGLVAGRLPLDPVRTGSGGGSGWKSCSLSLSTPPNGLAVHKPPFLRGERPRGPVGVATGVVLTCEGVRRVTWSHGTYSEAETPEPASGLTPLLTATRKAKRSVVDERWMTCKGGALTRVRIARWGVSALSTVCLDGPKDMKR